MIVPDTPISAIRPAEWRTNYVLVPDRKVLTMSLQQCWTGYILVRKEDSEIIDGFARWAIAQNDSAIRERDGDMVPVLWLDVDLIDAMVMHVRHNRGRGQIQAKPFSDLIRTIVRSGKYTQDELKLMFAMSPDELDLMLDGSLFKTRKLSAHKYSQSWIPIEAPPGSIVTPGPVIERPPNKDK